MLSQTDVVRHLLSVGLLDGRSVLDGDLRIEEVSRRNCCCKVQSSSGCYFVKLGADAEGGVPLAREAAAHRYLAAHATAGGALQQALCSFHGHDPTKRLLVLGLSPGVLNLREFHTLRGNVPNAVASATGSALAELHRMPLDDQIRGWRSADPAWALSLHRPHNRALRVASAANLELIRTVQGFPDFCRLLDGVRAEWEPVSLIHFDLKADNCLIVPVRKGTARSYEIHIVDWELAGPGDPCWDVGSIFGDYLGLWLLSIPVLADAPPERFLELTRFPLDRMVPAIRAFWTAYVEGSGFTGTAGRDAVLRSVRYAAARLIETAFGETQRSQRMNGNIVCLLQLSWNMLERPEQAATQLLGLPV